MARSGAKQIGLNKMAGPYTKPLLGMPSGYGWRDITAVATTAGLGTVAPTVGTITPSGYRTYYFADTAIDELHFCFHPNHDYRPGSDVYFHVHWSPSNTNTGVVEFKVDYSFARMQDATPTFVAFPAFSTLTMYQSGSGTQWAHQVCESTAFCPSGFETDGIMSCRLYRDARVTNTNDTYAGDAYILTADLHYEVGQIATSNRVRGTGWIY